jgi:hypothetical protein
MQNCGNPTDASVVTAQLRYVAFRIKKARIAIFDRI